jgi:hypothetical protein
MLARRTWLQGKIGIRLEADRVAWLQQRADECHLSVSAYIRKVLEEQAQRDLCKDDGNGHAA